MNEVAKVQTQAPTVGERVKLEKGADLALEGWADLRRAWLAATDERAGRRQVEAGAAARERWVVMGGNVNLARTVKQLARCETADWYDDEGQVKRAPVSKVLAALMGSFPTTNVPQPELFTRAMLEDVLATNPTWFALESACRRIRTTKTFMPAIAELLTVLAEEEAKWTKRHEALEWLEQIADDGERILQAARDATADEPLPPAPLHDFRPGARVIHPQYGRGEVDSALPDGVFVNFDSERNSSSLPVAVRPWTIEADPFVD